MSVTINVGFPREEIAKLLHDVVGTPDGERILCAPKPEAAAIFKKMLSDIIGDYDFASAASLGNSRIKNGFAKFGTKTFETDAEAIVFTMLFPSYVNGEAA